MFITYSSVGIASGYGLDGPGIESWWGAKFSAPVQTGTGTHPASCTMGTGSFLGVKSGRGVMLTPYSLLVLWSWKGRAIPLLPLWAVQPVQSLSLYKGALTWESRLGRHQCRIGRSRPHTEHLLRVRQILKKKRNTVKQYIMYCRLQGR
jgi:hypothetical protein